MGAKPRAERWLTEAFAEGVAERDPHTCWLAQHDPRRRPCEGRLEISHLIPRQRVENALGALLPLAGSYLGPEEGWVFDPADLILLAAWDQRNGTVACEHHHRRLDHARMPSLMVPYGALPDHAIEFAADWGLEQQLERRFPARVEG